MTRSIITSPITDEEAQQQMQAFKYINTGFNLYCEVLKRQGFNIEPDQNKLIDILAKGIVLGEHINHMAQNLKSGANDKLRYNLQAGTVEGVDVETILAKAKEVESV